MMCGHLQPWCVESSYCPGHFVLSAVQEDGREEDEAALLVVPAYGLTYWQKSGEEEEES